MSLIQLDTITIQESKILSWLRDNNLTNHMSDFVERPDAHNRFVSGIMGWQWEDEFATLCELRGFSCSKPKLDTQFDWVVNSKLVQCKFSMSTRSVDIRNKDKTFNRRYRPDAFDYMAIKSNNDVYVVPINLLLDSTLTQTKQSVKIEDIAGFKDNYEVFQ